MGGYVDGIEAGRQERKTVNGVKNYGKRQVATTRGLAQVVTFLTAMTLSKTGDGEATGSAMRQIGCGSCKVMLS